MKISKWSSIAGIALLSAGLLTPTVSSAYRHGYYNRTYVVYRAVPVRYERTYYHPYYRNYYRPGVGVDVLGVGGGLYF